MPEPRPQRISTFAMPQDLGNWLRTNHATSPELWVKIYKKDSGIPSVDWNDVVIEALCWGWIDGIKKSLDGEAYLQRITPRKPGGLWSKRNRDHVLRLVAEGRMEGPGLVEVRLAQADGRWDRAYVASQTPVPPDFLEAVEARPEAQVTFAELNKTQRLALARGLAVKRPETRQRRFDEFLAALARGEKPGM